MGRKRSKNITQEQVEKMRELREQGYSSNEIAKFIGCGRSTVNTWLRELGVASKHKRARLTGEQISKIRELTDKNYGSEQIAAIVGCCTDTVNRIQRDRGFRKKERFLTQDQINNILRLTTERYTQDEIAKRVGCSTFSVRKYQQINELPASNRSEASGRKVRFDYITNRNYGSESTATINKEEEPMKNSFSTTKTVVVPMTEKKEEKTMTMTPNTEYVNLIDAAIRFSGNKTDYDYGIKIFEDQLSIDFGGGNKIEIPYNKIASFSNELMDIAEKIQQMRKNFQSA